MSVYFTCPTRSTSYRPPSTGSRAPVNWLRHALRLLVIPAGVLGSSSCGGEAAGSAPYGAVAMADQDDGARGAAWSTPRRLWAGGATDFNAMSPSPDGRYVTAIDWTTGDLAVRDLADGQLHRVTAKGNWTTSGDYALGATFSPGGDQLAYIWWNTAAHRNELRTLRFDVDASGTPHGSDVRVIHAVPGLQPYFIHGWSSDNWILATTRRPGRTSALALVSAEDGDVRALESFDWRAPRAARSPDGRFVAYSLPTNAGSLERDIWLLSIDGRQKVAAVVGPTDDVVIGWQPDGSGLLFGRLQQGNSSLYRLPIARGEPAGPPELIHEDLPGRIVPLGLTSDELFVGVITERTQFHVARLDDLSAGRFDGTEPFTDPYGGSVRAWDWSADGSYIVHDARGSPGSPGFRIVVRSFHGELVRHFPLDGRAEFLRWAPDGRTIFMQAWDARDRPGVRALDLESGDIETLRQFDSEWQPMGGDIAVSPDGKHLYYRLLEPGALIERPTRGSIMRLDLETRREQVFAAVRWGGSLAVSPDGRTLAYVDYDAATDRFVIRVAPTAGGEPREILAREPGSTIAGINWTPDGSKLVFMSGAPEGDTRALFEVSVDGGDAGLLAAVPDLADSDPRIHPDGRRIVYRAGQPRGEIWALDLMWSVVETSLRKEEAAR